MRDCADSMSLNLKTGLRVALVTQGLSAVVAPLVSSKHQVVAVVEAANPRSKPRSWLRRLFRLWRKHVGRLRTGPAELEDYCVQQGIPYRRMLRSEQAPTATWLRKHCPDLLVVYSMSHLLGAELMGVSKLGVINLHPSYLPSYRGPSPDFWHFYHVELNPGVTVHYIDENEDTGDIVLQGRIEIPLGTTRHEYVERLIHGLGVDLLVQAIDSIAAGTAQRRKQATSSPTPRARRLKSGEAKGLVDWQHWDGTRIWHLMRGCEGYDFIDPPKGLYRGQSWKVGQFVPGMGPDRAGLCGSVGRDRSGCFVWCRDGRIRLSCRLSLRSLLRHWIGGIRCFGIVV
jgi:methionyl-tRNA formyltransferase